MRRRLAEKDGLIREEKGIVSDLKNQLQGAQEENENLNKKHKQTTKDFQELVA